MRTTFLIGAGMVMCALCVCLRVDIATGIEGDDGQVRFHGLSREPDQPLPGNVHLMTCADLLRSYQTKSCPYAESGGGPPQHMPTDLEDLYTLNGTVPTARFFVDDSNNSQVSRSVGQ